MQGYVPAQDGALAESRECFSELEDWMASEEAAGLQHGELEEQLDVRGRELLRRLFQDRLDLTAAREERRHDVAGEDGVVRTRAEKGRTRPLVTKFGQVTVSRIAYRSPGRANVHPLDAALNLPEEKHSHGLRSWPRSRPPRLVRGGRRGDLPRYRSADRETAGRAARGRCGRHVDAFYERAARRAPATCCWSCIRRQGHRDAPGGAARRPPRRPPPAPAASWPPGCPRVRRTAASGWPSSAASMTARPCPAPPPTSSPGPASAPASPGKDSPAATGKWLTSSVTDDIPAVIAAGFAEAARRDSGHERTWIALVDGNKQQIEAINAEAARRDVTITIFIDLCRARNYADGRGRPGRKALWGRAS